MTIFKVQQVEVRIFDSKADLGAAAAHQAAAVIRQAVRDRQWARIIVATGNSQLELVRALVTEQIDWNSVEIFHMDEYIGITDRHPASFRRWVRERLVERVHPTRAHYLAGDAPDIDGEIKRYSSLLLSRPIDLAFVGFGENAHIAFNDPGAADFHDTPTIKRVILDEACRQQQFGEGHFPSLDAVPKEALTLTCPALMRAETWICVVPDQRKARAVRCALEGPVSSGCPASLVRTHQNAFIYLDQPSASLLSIGSEN